MSTVGGWLTAHPELDRRDREVLLCRAAGLTRAQVLANPDRKIEGGVSAKLEGWAERRRRGEPVAYIFGEREFWGLCFEVSPAVLVPRPETELLVEAGLEVLETIDPHGRRVLDLGTGSGAVAIALAVEARARRLPLVVDATDLSREALEVAQANAHRHDVEITWRLSDWFSAVPGRYDLIVANPPYVAADDRHLAGLGHEPRMALVAGKDGLEAIRAIIAAAPVHLNPGGALLLEHGHDQGAAVRRLLSEAGFNGIATLSDLAGLERVTRGYLPRRCA